MLLKDKTVLVTGSAKRIGRIISLLAARQGADLILHYRSSKTAVESLAEEINNLGRKTHIFKADLSSPDQIQAFTENVFASHQVQILVNNASLFKNLSWRATDHNAWLEHQTVNLTAPFLLSQAFALAIPDGSSGRIINMLDWRALRPGADHFPYTISKAGLASLTRALAVSLAPAITVNGIALGAILPPVTGSASEEITNILPIPRWAEISELEETLLFLLTGPAYITGEIIHLDGGRHLI